MEKTHYSKNEKIILMVLPFLTPLCPPVGISCLKGYLQPLGYNIKTVDGMTDYNMRESCYMYFNTLKQYIPQNKRGSFFNVVLDVLTNHLMANSNITDENDYKELVKSIIYKNFFVNVNDNQIEKLNLIIDKFYVALETYILTLVNVEKPGIVGLSTYKGTLPASLYAAKIIKDKFPEIKILMGGTIFSQELYPNTPNFNLFMSKAHYIDKIFIGEGELLLHKYLSGELPKDKKVYTLEDIDIELINVKKAVVPDYSDFDISNYPMLPSYTSRGCVYKCSFCAETVYWRNYRKKSASKVVDEFIRLSNKYGRNLFMLTDCLINPLVNSLAEEITKRKLNFYWDVYLKVDDHVCDINNTHKWREGGFYRARLGVESGSQRILDIIDKRISVQQIKDAIISLASVGIKTTTYWIAGYPGETEEDFEQTLDLLEELQDYIYEAECDPFRYFYKGQVNGDSWLQESGNMKLYNTKNADVMLITQTWILNENPSREVAYERLCRFKEKCIQLGIPNPYSLNEIREADNRWIRLQKYAVPSVSELYNQRDTKMKIDILEVENIESLNFEDIDFAF